MNTTKKLPEEIRKIGIKLSKVQEAFIVDQVAPYFQDKKLIHQLKVRLKTNKEAKEEGRREALDDVEKRFKEEWKELKIQFLDDSCVMRIIKELRG